MGNKNNNKRKSWRNDGIIQLQFLGVWLSLFVVVDFSSAALLMPNVHTGCFDQPQVFLTVSSLAKIKNGALQDRIIEINWNGVNPQEDDWIGLFDHDPTSSIENPLYRNPVYLSRGHVKTDYRFERYDVQKKHRNLCLGFWVALVRVIVSNYILHGCMITNIIGDTPLHALMIPGTHNSGSFRYYEGNENVFMRYLINQDEPVYRQLLHGNRYLDIRVGYYPGSPERFYINHNFYRMRPLSSLVNDVRQFVAETGEIVILDFHRFPVGFAGNNAEMRHAQLCEYLNLELGQYLVSNTLWPNTTPNEIWGMNKSVIISYSDQKTTHKYPYLWPPLPQEWGDKRNLPELKSFLYDSLQKRGGKGHLWAAMAEFTPKPLDIVLRPTHGLRQMAQTVNVPMTYWFQDKLWYPRSNIIATDFFLGNNIIETSIIANLKGLKCSL